MQLDFADVKPSLVSWIIVTLLAATGIVALKVIFNKWPVSGVTEMVNAI